MTNEPYNPLDKRHLGESVTAALLKSPVVPLPPPMSFNGAGIYALYFHGDSPAWYAKIAAKNRNDQWAAPIYVGKAVPPGARKGAYGLDASPGEVLYRRLREHAESILQVENLSLEGFKFYPAYARYPAIAFSISSFTLGSSSSTDTRFWRTAATMISTTSLFVKR